MQVNSKDDISSASGGVSTSTTSYVSIKRTVAVSSFQCINEGTRSRARLAKAMGDDDVNVKKVI